MRRPGRRERRGRTSGRWRMGLSGRFFRHLFPYVEHGGVTFIARDFGTVEFYNIVRRFFSWPQGDRIRTAVRSIVASTTWVFRRYVTIRSLPNVNDWFPRWFRVDYQRQSFDIDRNSCTISKVSNRHTRVRNFMKDREHFLGAFNRYNLLVLARVRAWAH